MEELYYPCCENKGADQLRSYCEADLRLYFRIGKNPVFSRCRSITKSVSASNFEFCEKHVKNAKDKVNIQINEAR